MPNFKHYGQNQASMIVISEIPIVGKVLEILIFGTGNLANCRQH